MSIELWVGVGELVGAIAVVVTLIYLAVQIRASNREARSGTLQSALSNEMDMLTVFIDNASVWDKIVSGSPLEEGEETRKGVLLYGLLMTETESRFHQYELGYLDEGAWAHRLPAVRWAVNNRVHEKWRRSPGASARSKRFLQLLDDMVDQMARE
jgi:hypothetical protein